MHLLKFTLLALPLVSVLLAQDKPADAPAPPPMTPVEQEFQKSLDHVIFEGVYTADDTGEVHKDKYTIDGVTKVKDDLWKVTARIQYNGKDVKFAMNVPLKWAGDTPMIHMTNFGVAMMGSFTVRLLIYKDEYAGTWRGSPTHAASCTERSSSNLPPTYPLCLRIKRRPTE